MAAVQGDPTRSFAHAHTNLDFAFVLVGDLVPDHFSLQNLAEMNPPLSNLEPPERLEGLRLIQTGLGRSRVRTPEKSRHIRSFDQNPPRVLTEDPSLPDRPSDRVPEARRPDDGLHRHHHFLRPFLELQIRHPVGLDGRPLPVQEMVLAFRHIAQGLVFLSPGDPRPELQHTFLKPVQIRKGLTGLRIDFGRLGPSRPGGKSPQEKDCDERGAGSLRQTELRRQAHGSREKEKRAQAISACALRVVRSTSAYSTGFVLLAGTEPSSRLSPKYGR